MWKRVVLVLWLAAGASQALASGPPRTIVPASPPGCAGPTIGVDTSRADGRDGPILGEAVGQTFLAADTLIQSITVWRPIPPDTNVFGIHIWVTTTDATGRPVAIGVIQNGPTLSIPFGDNIHPVRYDFVFDPPVALPRPGLYYFALTADPCFGFWDILQDDRNDYPDGEVWENGRTTDCHLRIQPSAFPSVDLVFTISFCHAPTPTLGTSWGALKTLYR